MKFIIFALIPIILSMGIIPTLPNIDAEETKTIFIDSHLVDCVGVGPQKCMLIRENQNSQWGNFYGNIEGFNFVEGNIYQLSVKITDIENPPADSSSLKYELLEIIAKNSNQICIDKIWIENARGKIACVTPTTAEKLVERGWGTILDDETSEMSSSETDENIESLKSQIELLQQKISQYELEQDTVQGNLDLFDELDLVAFNNRDMERIAEIHMPDVKVINRDGKVTEPYDPNHKDELLFLFETFPDFSINEHPIGFGQGNWTAGLSISTGTFLNPMELPDGTVIEPTGESFEVRIVTLANWEGGRIVEEYLIWDNEDWMKQIGLN